MNWIALTLVALAPLARAATSPTGEWRGQSICTIRDSPCHDETVVYYITGKAGNTAQLAIAMNKIVNGEEQWMGTVDCSYDSSRQTISCDMSGNIWLFQMNAARMTGTLTLKDKRLYRRISLRRPE